MSGNALKRVAKYKVRWKVKGGYGFIEFLFDDGTSGTERLNAEDFQAVCAILFNSDGENPVYVGEGFVGTKEDIGAGPRGVP